MAKGVYKEWLTEEALTLVAGWALDGLIDEDIAYNIGISKTTFYEWKKHYPAFANALKRTKEVADRRVESALYKRAMGFTTQEITEENGKKRIVTKEVSPDTTAMIFWLKNRMTNKYRDVKPIELTGAEGKDLSISVTIDDVDKDKE